jgi:putative DNA primase/helicase
MDNGTEFLDRLIDEQPRSYAEIIADAETMDQKTDPDKIDALVKETASLSSIHRRRIFDTIKKCTGIPLGALNDSLQENSGREQMDHLALARKVIDVIGPENILSSTAFTYRWLDTGVWKKQEERAIRQLVQHNIEDSVDKVDRSLVESTTDLLKTEVFQSEHEFDVGPPETVNCLNGELSLIDGRWQLLPHKREHYRTTQTPVEYDLTAKAPRFMQFLSEIFKGDPDADEKSKALLEMIGYTLMAHCRHERFIILVGGGANGKSVLLAVLESLTGLDNIAGVQPSQFDRSFQRAHLHGKLANIVTEIKQGEVIDDASLKGIVSGEPTTVEHKFRDPFTMRTFSTCWFGTNHMPHTRDFSDALFRRALVVQFSRVFKPELGNCDPQLKDKLMAELPGILNLSLDAYAKALEDGFTMPQSCLDAIR